ncbi:MAG TPA: MFS transporter [Maritimibacter sp.]|nr:MFS transporter [Maritimibacter sp.]
MTQPGSRAGRPLAAYIVVTAAYWAFMLTDGALRMLVLLHFNQLGFSPITLAWLFLLYEIAGMVTNLAAGWIAARFGLTTTLYVGLGLQVVALVALSWLDPGWAVAVSVPFVMVVQGLSGVAKDLSKMSSKSAVKLLAPEADDGLFKWVAVLTGSKNAVKGFGFFLGAGLLAVLGFKLSVLVMAAVLAVILIGVMVSMPVGLPKGSKSAKFAHVFSKDPKINRLSLARMFLFGARDTWFVVGIPIFFHDRVEKLLGTDNAFFIVGGFMALWIIAYGAIQAAAPKLLGPTAHEGREATRLAIRWVGILTAIPAVLAVAAVWSDAVWLLPVAVIVLLAFGFVFAINSSLHSYLILAFTKSERVTMDVGFYYMSNAAGRLIGTLLSGVSYQLGGLVLCLATAAVMAGLSWVAARRIEAVL